MDAVIEALLTADLARLLNRVTSDASPVVAAKQLAMHEEANATLARWLDRLGMGPAAVSRLAMIELPALFASLYASEGGATIEPRPSEWRSDIKRIAWRYVSASDLFSLNLMNVGLNLCQAELFTRQDIDGRVLELGSGNCYVSSVLFGTRVSGFVASDLLPSAVANYTRYGFSSGVAFDMHAMPYAHDAFPTIVSVHSVDNAGRREQTLKEAFRVLEPGGRLIFTDYLKGFMDRRPYMRMLKAIGLKKYGSHLDGYVRSYSIDSYDSTDYSLDEYKDVLTRIGFEVEVSQTFFGAPLVELCYLLFDMELSLRTPHSWAWLGTHATAVESTYRTIASEIMVPMVYQDFLEPRPHHTQVFFVARKPGRVPAHSGDERDFRLMCPQCKGELAERGGGSYCLMCEEQYETVAGVPMMIAGIHDVYRKISSLPVDRTRAALSRVYAASPAGIRAGLRRALATIRLLAARNSGSRSS